MRWPLFAMFAALAGIAWASYAALVGYVGGRAFKENLLLGLLVGFAFAAAVFAVTEGIRRIRRARAARDESEAGEASLRTRTSSPNSKRSSGPPSKSRSSSARV
jgi:hypothetical protein